MPFRKIDKQIKDRAVWLSDNGWLKKDIRDVLDVSKSSIKRWKRHLHTHGSTIPPPNPFRPRGRPSTLDAMQTAELIAMLKDNPEILVSEIQDWVILSQDIGLSKSAIRRIIHDLGYTYKALKKAAAERDDDYRQEWMANMKSKFVASQYVFVDESSKDDRTIFRRWGWSVKGQRAMVHSNFVRGTRYSIVAGIALDGYLPARVVEGSVNSASFYDYIVEEVVSLYFMLFSLSLTAF